MMTDETKAESIVRALHGKVPPWASGAVVTKSEPDDDADREPNADGSKKLWYEDATFEAVGHTGVLSCSTVGDYVHFKAVRRPSPKALRRYGRVPILPRMLEVVQTIGPDYVQSQIAYGIGRGRRAALGSTAWVVGAPVHGRLIALAAVLGSGAPFHFNMRERQPLLGFKLDGQREQAVSGDAEFIFAMLALRRRYEWHVAMRIDGAPALTFACTPASARSAYRLRDLAPGKNRRDALIHWVAEHYRNPSIHVSEHLRGKHTFSWRGIDCEIVPSAFDREKEIARKASKQKGAA